MKRRKMRPGGVRPGVMKDDEGELAMRFAVQDGCVIIAFGKPVGWIGLPPAEVRGFIAMLQKQLAILEGGGEGEP